ncbi:MAG: serine/threonine-protein phosphatase, partial [Actinomycetia bacterium]|nr:serine/threonine-protein phosphatase [Actinomycetes bacterium]
GDFFEIFENKNTLICAIGDVSGKSLPAAFYMYMSYSMVHTLLQIKSVDSVLIKKMNNIILKKSKQSMFLTLGIMEYDNIDKKAVLYSAGHNPFIYYNAEKSRISEINPAGPPLGILKNPNFKKTIITPSKNDILLIYSDGITEARNQNFSDFGEEKLKDIIMEYSYKNAHQLSRIITDKIFSFTKSIEIFDDMTLLVMKWLK